MTMKKTFLVYYAPPLYKHAETKKVTADFFTEAQGFEKDDIQRILALKME